MNKKNNKSEVEKACAFSQNTVLFPPQSPTNKQLLKMIEKQAI